MPPRCLLLLAAGAAVLLTAPARAEITDLRGRALVELKAFLGDELRDHIEANDEFPETTTTLPLHALARLVDPFEEAAASVASQFADPRTAPGPNPEEFAVNLTLSSLSPSLRYSGTAVAEETRRVVFRPAEVNDRPAGTTVDLVGTLFLDAALVVLGDEPQRDLTGATLTLHITIEQQPVPEAAAEKSPVVVFDGSVTLAGTVSGGAEVSATGDLPRDRFFIANLGTIAPDFDAIHVLVLPAVQLDYEYQAVVDEPFELVAALRVEAACAPGGTSVAAIIGTPLELLAEVLALTSGDELAAKEVQRAVLQERASPTGLPAFPAAGPAFPPLFGLCGLLGFESLIGVVALGGWAAHGYRRRR